jgi:hypothetical protein
MRSTGIPLVLLDVDGVLNILGDDAAPSWDVVLSGRATAEGTSFAITWSPDVIDRINSWINAEVEIQWLTTWGYDANNSLRHLVGLPELTVAGTHNGSWQGVPEDKNVTSHAAMAPAAPDPLTGEWWKYDVVKRLLSEQPGRLLVWVDDELFPPTRFRRWADEHESIHPIGPDGHLGLTEADIEEIEALLDLKR